MKKNYVRCPYCKKKTLLEQHICSNCKRLLPSEIVDKSIIPRLIILVVLALLIVGTYYYINNKEIIKEEINLVDFSKVAEKINYNSDYNEDKLIYVKDKNILINTKGKILVDNINSLEEDCDYFYIITKREKGTKYYYLIDNDGKELYKDKEKIYYYPKHNNFLIGKDLYFNNQKVASNVVLDKNLIYSGDYYSYNDGSTGGIINYKGEKLYQIDIDKFLYLESPSKKDMLESNYCIINKDYHYALIDCDTGEIVIDYESREIEELNNNVYKINNIVFYVDSSKRLIYYEKEPDEIEYTSKYFINDKLLLGKQLINTKNGMPYNNEVIISNIEIENNIKTSICKNVNIYYEMSVNDEEFPCIYDNIGFFSNKINDYLKDKIYVVLDKNNGLSLYDIKRGKFINMIESISYYSPLIVYEDNDNRYVYNLKTDDNKILNEKDKITIYDNYYVIEKLDLDNMTSNEEYYGLDLEKIKIK